MRCDFWAPLLACNLASPCFGHKPRARVVTLNIGLEKVDDNGVLITLARFMG